jgi:hypothetical protein
MEPTTMNEPPTPDTRHAAPAHSVWPLVVAAGPTAILFGLVTSSLGFVAVGALALLVGIVGWLREL